MTEINGSYSQPYYGVYIQDDYRITPRLTLNLGLRWEYEAPRVEEQNRSRISITPAPQCYRMAPRCEVACCSRA